MSIPAKPYRKPLELFAKVGDMVIFAKTKYKPYTKILKSLKSIKMLITNIEITSISIIKNW